MLEKINGVVIKSQDYGESNKIITIFSKKLGKFSAIARGAKKPKSRMAAVTQPFIYGEFLVYVSKGLSTIQQGDILYSFRKIRENIVKTAYAAYISELTDRLLNQQEVDVYLFDQFYKTMEWIDDHEDADIPILMYELKLYKKNGFAPTVDRCVNCGAEEDLTRFSVAEGGLLCKRCQHLDRHATLISNILIKWLTIFLEVGLERIGNIQVKEENKRLLRKMMDEYYDQYGGYYIKSRKVLKQLDSFK